MQSGITVCRTAIAHAALLALCGAAQNFVMSVW